MKPTGDDVLGLIARCRSAVRRRDAENLTSLMQQLTGRTPQTWGTIIGFGSCSYRYPTGTTGDCPILSFAPRASATTIYLLDGVEAHTAALSRLGEHSTGVGCVYIPDLDRIDLDVLRGILTRSLAWAESGGDERIQLAVTG
ncbi:DUF1801 domain-containing protein [Microbacterium sp. NPDC089320]|uniref:DUF1801 domain-containing protein n=1 Tax=Microbacterium sp. NPDC089320 TaxID=3155182 RepID=UPI0034256F64